MRVNIHRIDHDFEIGELEHKSWKAAAEVRAETYWSGDRAPSGRHFSARLLWSESSLYVRFDANRAEPVNVKLTPDLETKSMGLWERDVCEIFLAPDAVEPDRYFEFEVAPTGEWVDLRIHQLAGKRETDWGYSSGMKTAARIESDRVLMAVKVPWSAFGRTPRTNESWRGNLFRCVGTNPDRGFVAWSPTLTETPNFHVPERFGEFLFAS